MTTLRQLAKQENNEISAGEFESFYLLTTQLVK